MKTSDQKLAIKKVLITDLDNTLFDWVKMWYHSFSALMDKTLEISGIDRKTYIREAKQVHQNHGTSEYTFLLEEMPSVKDSHSSERICEIFDDAIHAYNSARKKNLNLYEGVEETLLELNNRGTLIVGFTESQAFVSFNRVKKLELDGIMDFLFSPPDHEIPNGVSRDKIRKNPSEDYLFKKTKHKMIELDDGRKPNPKVMLDIIKSVGANVSDCVYVGDSLYKDIKMAQDANVDDVHAEYGTAHKRKEYELLKEVTHWRDEDVEKEKHSCVQPSYKLVKSFKEILDLFDFRAFS